VAIANPETAQGLVELAALLAQRVPGTLINALTVVRTADHPRLSESLNRLISRFARRQRDLLERVAHDLQNRNIPFFVDVRVADTISDGIIEDLAENADTRLLLMGWPGALSPEALAEHPVTTVMDETTVDMAVFLDRGLGSIKRVLVPFGGGIHARLALRLASELAEATEGQVVAYRCFCEAESDDIHDEMLLMREAIETEYGTVPETLDLRVVDTPSLLEGVRQELAREHYDLVVMGAAVAHSLGADLFGVMTDLIAEEIPTSVLLVRRGQAAVVDWLRRRAKAVIPEPASQTAAAPDRDPETFETDVSR
jgi:nucleotide-binding universal stress UspA family protein